MFTLKDKINKGKSSLALPYVSHHLSSILSCSPSCIASETMLSDTDKYNSSTLKAYGYSQKPVPSDLNEWHESSEEELDGSFPDIERDDMLARRFGTFRKFPSPVLAGYSPLSVVNHQLKQQGNIDLWRDWKTPLGTERSETGNQQLCRFVCLLCMWC